MEIYIVIWEDRHGDTEAYPFSDEEVAVEWAQEKAQEMDRHGDLDESMNDTMINAGWLYRGQYSVEGCHLRVVRKTLDGEL